MELKKEMMELGIDEIRTNPFQAREYFDEGKIQILADSIKEHGLNTPIQLVWDIKPDGKKATLKDGERRIRALKKAGYKKLRYGDEYIFKEVKDDADLEYKGLIANCMREDLQPVEKGKAFFKILHRRGIKDLDMAITAVNRAKDWIDNGFMAEPSSRNYFVTKETIQQVAKDMKMIGVSGTNAIDLLKITRLPKDIQTKIFFAPPNSRIIKEKMKINRMGDLVTRKGNDRGDYIPIAFARELTRLGDERLLRFFLKNAFNSSWTSRKLTLMVNDYLESKLKPEAYIEAYKRGDRETHHGCGQEMSSLISSMDTMASTLTSWRTINLVAVADAFKQKEFAITGKGLLTSTCKLKQALENALLNTRQLNKVKEEEKKVMNTPFRVTLTTPPKQRNGYRFSIPSEFAQKLNAKQGDTLEITINAIIKPVQRVE